MATAIKASRLFLFAILTVGGVAWGQAQTGFQFNFLSPGARSLGMGGAFIGLADDATAAYTNPAGLTNLTVGGSEAAIEYRQFNNTTLYVAGGRLDGSTPTGIGFDTTENLVSGKAEAETSGISFFSYSKVLPHGITLALYRQQLANYSAEHASQGPFLTDLYTCTCSRAFPSVTKVDLRIANYGISAAYAFQLSSNDPVERSAGSISVGLGLTASQLDLNFKRFFFGFSRRTGFNSIDRQPGGFFGPADFTPDNAFMAQMVQDKDYAQGFNLGVLWKQGEEVSPEERRARKEKARRWDYLSHGRWSVGAAYRKGPSFQVVGSTLRRDGSEPEPSTLDLRVPDTYGLGIAYSMGEGNTKVTLDYDRVRWSQRFDEIIPEGTQDRDNFFLGDPDELHLGFEQVVFVLESQVIGTLRLGAWREPAHEVEYRGTIPEHRAVPKGSRHRPLVRGNRDRPQGGLPDRYCVGYLGPRQDCVLLRGEVFLSLQSEIFSKDRRSTTMIRPFSLVFSAALVLAPALNAQTIHLLTPATQPFPFDKAKAMSLSVNLTPATGDLETPGSPRTQGSGSGSPPFTSSRVIVSDSRLLYPYPYSPVGKVYVQWPDGAVTYCSGAVIGPRILLTAGHCVHRGTGGPAGYAQRLVFAPGFFEGEVEEVWEGSALLPSPAWAQGGGNLPNGADYALVALADNRFGRAGDAVGPLNLAIGRLFPNHVTMLGYPTAYDAGQRMHVVTSQSFKRGKKGTVLYPGDMGDGADGGPWIESFGDPAEEQPGEGFNMVVGVTSYAVRERDGSSLVVSSELGQELVYLLGLLCGQDINNCI